MKGLHPARRPITIFLVSEAIAFDTHRFVKHLTASGFTEQQAEALASEQVNLLNSNLATKADIESVKAEIEALRQETKAEIEALRQETKASIDSLRQETKAGIDSLRQETKASIASLRQETKADIESVKADLLKWMFGAMIAQGGLIVALVKLL